MYIEIRNIGIIKDSKIKLDGLSIITGKNNSGKTTVGKILYSYLDGIADIPANVKIDKDNYVKGTLSRIMSQFSLIFDFDVPPKQQEYNDFITDYPCMIALLNLSIFKTKQNYKVFVQNLLEELKKIDVDKYYVLSNLYKQNNNEKSISFIKDHINVIINLSIDNINKMLGLIDNDPTFVNYTQERINTMFETEFSNQIQLVKKTVEKSEIIIQEDKLPLVKLNFSNNKLIKKNIEIPYISNCKRVYLIDNPFVLDERLDDYYEEVFNPDLNFVIDYSNIFNHNDRLKNVLRSKVIESTFEKTIINKSIEDIKIKINKILPGTFEFSDDGDFYITDGNKLKVSNLATGSKLFSIVKILLEKGEIDDSTMLIFDEPEAHLHPEWQNDFAEIITLLVKELGVKVVLTSHSPNFVLALEANMRKYGISDKTNFYRTIFDKDGMVNYESANDNLEVIYGDFLSAFAKMKALRDNYI